MTKQKVNTSKLKAAVKTKTKQVANNETVQK
jgi:hypothetical protein